MSRHEDHHGWERAAIALLTAIGTPVAAATRVVRTIARIARPRDQTTVDGVPITEPQPNNSNPGPFATFMGLPPEIRQMVWKEMIPLAPRILIYEKKCDDTTTFDINLYSRAQTSIATACFESREIFQENRDGMYGNDATGILAVSPKLDIIHFGPEFELNHLESFAERIGTAKAKGVRHLILEYQIENAYYGNGVQRMFSPKFFKICSLLPELRVIIFVSHDQLRGSDTLAGDLVFSKLDSTKMSGADRKTFSEFAEDQYPFYLERQLVSRDMNNRRPKIVFMEPVEVSTQQN